ncbi:hypothetical protein GCM10023153_22320 [Ornithinibacter aureus]|uniref:Uncharacterized protein n=1 Tax=Ornithinibacter aureus TaxID=622664 RepID=A0ABP8JY54_9MICO|nr:ArsR family transcriptional regulator [Ornithinibacter aureus]KAF0834673.1 hypothetical protein C8E84_2507 [Ornithinibacter aureus]
MTSDISTDLESEEALDPDAVKATPESTRDSIVKATGSGYTPVRHILVQKYSGRNRASTLGKLVRERKHRELILYLLVLTAWDDGARPAWPAAVWLRALTVSSKPNMTWSRSSLSETWTALVELKLVKRNRERRRSRITPRNESRRGVYDRPDGKTTANHYLVLPGAFWADLWFDRLSLAGVAVLLILLKETGKDEEVHMTYGEAASWYGFSESTAKKGFQELVAVGLAETRDTYKRADYAEDGYSVERWYWLTGDFSTAARESARKDAARARRMRARKVKAVSKS